MYVNPIALAAIGYHYYFFYLALNCFWLACIYFYFPETRGYSLEELAALFDDDAMVIKGMAVEEEGDAVSVRVDEKK